MEAKDDKCCICGEQAVAYYPCIDPDIPSYPYCADHLEQAMIDTANFVWSDDKDMLVIATYQAKEACKKYRKNKVMKANVPERIWINPTTDIPKLSGVMDKNSVEYVHNNAFVDKAFEFFGEHLWEYIDVKNANCDTFINIDGDKLKEDFRNYIKGK